MVGNTTLTFSFNDSILQLYCYLAYKMKKGNINQRC